MVEINVVSLQRYLLFKVVKTHRPIDVGDINITYHAPAYGTVKKLHNSRGLGCKQNTNNA